jgi:hypothetical protein
MIRLALLVSKYRINPIFGGHFLHKSNFNKRENLEREKKVHKRFPVRSDSFHRHNVQRFAGLYIKRELYACFCPSRLSKIYCRRDIILEGTLPRIQESFPPTDRVQNGGSFSKEEIYTFGERVVR